MVPGRPQRQSEQRALSHQGKPSFAGRDLFSSFVVARGHGGLSTVEVPTPPITEQRIIAARLREQLAEIDRAKAALEAQRAAVDALPAALLREVFGQVIAA